MRSISEEKEIKQFQRQHETLQQVEATYIVQVSNQLVCIRWKGTVDVHKLGKQKLLATLHSTQESDLK